MCPIETLNETRGGGAGASVAHKPAFRLVRERRRRDLNPRTRECLLFSRQVHSAALPRLPCPCKGSGLRAPPGQRRPAGWVGQAVDRPLRTVIGCFTSAGPCGGL